MIKLLAVDIGNTLIEPISGDWDITCLLRQYMLLYDPENEQISTIKNNIKNAKLLNSDFTIADFDDEYMYYVRIYEPALQTGPVNLSSEEVEMICRDRVDGRNLYKTISPFFEYVNEFNKTRKALFSNTYPSVIRFLKNSGMDIDDFGLCLSYSERMKKPDPKIFYRLLEINDVSADEILLVDDNTECINTARDMGFNTVLFNKTQIERCIKEIESLI